MTRNRGVSQLAPDFGFDRWLRAIHASIEAATASDLAAEAALARLSHELTTRSQQTAEAPPGSPAFAAGSPAFAAGLPVEALLTAVPLGDRPAPVAEWASIVAL